MQPRQLSADLEIMPSSRSCLECNRRHIACDRKHPCSYCSRLGIRCAYPESGPVDRDSRSDAARGNDARIRALEETVRRLEERLAGIEGNAGMMLLHSSTYQSSRSNDSDSSSSSGGRTDISTTRMPPGSSTATMTQQLADTTFPRSLWIEYMSNIDPLLKVMDHQFVEDTLLTYPHHCIQGKAVLLAISFANQACKIPVPKVEYRNLEMALKHTLELANVYNRPTIQTVQALTLYLTCGRANMDQDYLSRTLRVLIQLAVKLDLHRNPAELGYTPSQCEGRRRLWWHIMALDVRTAEASCSHLIIQAQRIVVATTQDTPATDGHDPSSFHATVAVEMAQIAREVLFTSSVANDRAAQVELSDKLHDDLFAKYFSQCDCTDSPVCTLTLEWCKIYRERQKLLLHWDQVFLRKIDVDESTNTNEVLQTCTDIMMRVQNLRTTAVYSRWAWLWQNCVEWDVSAVALCMIATEKCVQGLVQQAWPVIDAVYMGWTDDMGDPAHHKRWSVLKTFRGWVQTMHLGRAV